MMRKGRNQIKSCPFRQEACQKQGCKSSTKNWTAARSGCLHTTFSCRACAEFENPRFEVVKSQTCPMFTKQKRLQRKTSSFKDVLKEGSYI